MNCLSKKTRKIAIVSRPANDSDFLTGFDGERDGVQDVGVLIPIPQAHTLELDFALPDGPLAWWFLPLVSGILVF